MKRLGALLVVALAGCSSPSSRVYSFNDLQLLTAHAAKEQCSCLFVFGRDEKFCTAWTRAAPDLKTLHVDWDAKVVESEAIVAWGARARYVDARRGCVLE